MFILTLKLASQLCYEKSAPHLAKWKKAMCVVYLFHTFTFPRPAWWHAGFAQASSAQAAMIWWGRIRLRVEPRDLHCTDCPPQAAESPVCTPEAETAITRGMQRHPVFCIRRGRISCAAQAKKEEVLRVTNNLLHPSELNPLQQQQKKNRNREKKKKVILLLFF